MSVVASAAVLAGVVIIVLASIGLNRLRTPYARLHAAGKASPTAFVLIAVGVSIELGWIAAAQLAVAVIALTLTLPIAVHLLFRAVHHTEPDCDPLVDELRDRLDGEPDAMRLR